MEKELLIQGQYKGKICFDYLPCINYAMILNDDKVFLKFVLKNDDTKAWNDVHIYLTGEMFETCYLDIQHVDTGHEVDFVDANLIPTASKLMTLTEAVQTEFIIHIDICGKEVMNNAISIMIMAFDQWHGSTIMQELIAAFVTPNHPALSPILLRSSELLGEMSGNNSLDSYQSGDYQRVVNQLESVYNALLEQELVYAINPASFQTYGQRIRLVNKVLNEKLGNCLELSLLLCSCLESIGIKTVIVFFDGHAFMGVWLNPTVHVSMVGYDKQMLIDSVDNFDLLLIESTKLTCGTLLTEAIKNAYQFICKEDCNFEYFVDITEARHSHIRPLPQSIHTDNGWQITNTANSDRLFDKLENKDPYEIHGFTSAHKLKNKQMLWERKLLDLSLRNSLLNMKSGKRIVPLPSKPIDEILMYLDKEELICLIDNKDNFSTIKELYRAARNSIEENGANTLFLSVGTMRWYEKDGTRPYFAPILFIPVEIVRHGFTKYLIRPRDEEPIINITLIEMMRQTFDLRVPNLSTIPLSEEGNVDWQCVFSILQSTIDPFNDDFVKKGRMVQQWQIIEECMLGIFSFSKFVMWNDIHTHSNIIAHHKLLRSMVEGHITWNATDLEPIDAHALDTNAKPADFAIPLDVDSSQLEAIADSDRGNTFILYGPPGTGKSQTITNMIANAMYHGKRVLFVAEKKAALEVVQNRLRKIGLDPFCLELHSNKVDKKSFLAQMEASLNARENLKCNQDEFRKLSNALYDKRQELNNYIEALHKKREIGMSLYDCINRYLGIEGEYINLQYKDISHLQMNEVEELCDEYEQMDTVINILHRHPSDHPLLHILPRVNTAENQRLLVQLLASIPFLITKARKKERTWWNKWFYRHTALQFIQKENEWLQLLSIAEISNNIASNLDAIDGSIQIWNNSTDLLRDWYHYSVRTLKIQEYNVPKVHDYFLEGRGGKATADAMRKGFYYRMAMYIIDNDDNLRTFNGMLFDQIIEKYRYITHQFQELTKEELFYRISANIPDETEDNIIGEELTTLRKRIANHGRAMSVRRIISQAQHILPSLTPCMLMSPLSVAQYLDMTEELFDLVIFDEASQMPTSEAVGAIARGKAVVVVGDPKQMPPTSFFTSCNTIDDDIEIDDLESILDDSISLSVPSRYLNWHYRSKHESLIAFSNTHFYDGRLITFPSIDDQARKVTIQYIDGTYDFGKSRQNKAEAKVIVNEVIERLKTYKNSSTLQFRSIGIVAFSKVQSNLIEDLLIDALARNKDLESLAFNEQEPIFVKNLENVQGDERDIILFSVGYGPDKSGKVSMNFGPLNQIGGERRLNVAVSRARYEMKVFSTLHPEQIDLQRTNAIGVIAMKRFLEYAEYGSIAQPNTQITTTDTYAITKKIASRLEERGYEVHLNVGRSKFKVDLAVIDPEMPERYKLGIILDGPNYAHTPTARDREIIQPSILQSLGWTICHIWTADWVMRAEEKLNEIEKFILAYPTK